MKFAIGDKAVEKSQLRAHTSYNVMEVVGTLNGDLLLQHFGFAFDGEITNERWVDKPRSRSWREGIQRYQEDELCTPEEALAEIKKLEAAKSKLEEEFGAVQELIGANLAQAAALVETAANLAVKCNKTFEDVLNESVPLYKALKKGGWRHSTLQCKVG